MPPMHNGTDDIENSFLDIMPNSPENDNFKVQYYFKYYKYLQYIYLFVNNKRVQLIHFTITNHYKTKISLNLNLVMIFWKEINQKL